MTADSNTEMAAPTGEIRVGIVSDTHITLALELPPQLAQALQGVDLILHAGDIMQTRVLDELEQIAPVLAAKGDEDPDSLLSDPRIKEDQYMRLGGLLLWLRHRLPWGVMADLTCGQETQAIKRIAGECPAMPDIVVFGDTHRADIRRLHGVLLVNPGSATLPNYEIKPGTAAILTIASGQAQARLVYLDGTGLVLS